MNIELFHKCCNDVFPGINTSEGIFVYFYNPKLTKKIWIRLCVIGIVGNDVSFIDGERELITYLNKIKDSGYQPSYPPILDGIYCTKNSNEQVEV